ncbi:MAG: hypothetical protein OEN49_09105 [Gammaproteobacteria bacterium]|nr:hypothetical protein [Gammaproteobacteria bacterium]
MKNNDNGNLPFVAIGNDELGGPVPDDALIKCKRCGTPHKLEYGTNAAGVETKIVGFVRCGEEAYLVAVDGHLVFSNEVAP